MKWSEMLLCTVNLAIVLYNLWSKHKIVNFGKIFNSTVQYTTVPYHRMFSSENIVIIILSLICQSHYYFLSSLILIFFSMNSACNNYKNENLIYLQVNFIFIFIHLYSFPICVCRRRRCKTLRMPLFHITLLGC